VSWLRGGRDLRGRRACSKGRLTKGTTVISSTAAKSISRAAVSIRRAEAGLACAAGAVSADDHGRGGAGSGR
jgi:hypothetical protein